MKYEVLIKIIILESISNQNLYKQFIHPIHYPLTTRRKNRFIIASLNVMFGVVVGFEYHGKTRSIEFIETFKR